MLKLLILPTYEIKAVSIPDCIVQGTARQSMLEKNNIHIMGLFYHNYTLLYQQRMLLDPNLQSEYRNVQFYDF